MESDAANEIVIQTVQLSTVADILAIILSIVAVVITIIGFFASLRFYREGMELQNSANDALVKIEEKANSIHTQVGGMFEKTLDAAISKSDALDISFETITDQLDEARKQIVASTMQELGDAGNREKEKLEAVVNQQLDSLGRAVEETREDAEKIAALTITEGPNSRLQNSILQQLSSRPGYTSHTVITSEMGMSLASINRALDRLKKRGLVEEKIFNDDAQYRIAS